MNEGLLKLISENIVDGELPREFSLTKGDDDGSIKFADGARDGIAKFHFGRQQLTDEISALIEKAFSLIADRERALVAFDELFEKISPISAIDFIQGYIYDHTDCLDPNALHGFAMDCLYSDKIDTVKLALILLEVFNEPQENLKKHIRTLGLSDEFTIFTVFHMMHWTGGNSEIFELAKHVHGWGKIHAVERLSPDTQEIRDWLLKEGCNNDIIPEYSALEVFNKAEVAKLLKVDITDEQLSDISFVIRSMLSEGPVTGISAVENADEVITDLLSQIEKHKLTLSVCEAVLSIANCDKLQNESVYAEKILNSLECRKLTDEAITRCEGLGLADKLGIDSDKAVFELMQNNFEKGWYLCYRLIKKDGYREKVLDLFRTKLPLKSMESEPQDCMGLGKDYSDYNKLIQVIQNLGDYPLCGTDLVLAGLKSPVINNRNMALRVIDSWRKANNCSLKELSEDLYAAVEYLKSAEVSDSVKKNIEEYGF